MCTSEEWGMDGGYGDVESICRRYKSEVRRFPHCKESRLGGCLDVDSFVVGWREGSFIVGLEGFSECGCWL